MKRLLLLPILLIACDEVIEVNNQPPEARAEGLCVDGGRVFFLVGVRDYEGAPVDVDLVLDVDGEPTVIGSGTGGDGTVGLTSQRSRPGVVHRIEWGAPCSGEPNCVDPCADRVAGPSGLTTCSPAPASLPERLTLTIHASDGQAVAVDTFELGVSETCE